MRLDLPVRKPVASPNADGDSREFPRSEHVTIEGIEQQGGPWPECWQADRRSCRVAQPRVLIEGGLTLMLDDRRLNELLEKYAPVTIVTLEGTRYGFMMLRNIDERKFSDDLSFKLQRVVKEEEVPFQGKVRFSNGAVTKLLKRGVKNPRLMAEDELNVVGQSRQEERLGEESEEEDDPNPWPREDEREDSAEHEIESFAAQGVDDCQEDNQEEVNDSDSYSLRNAMPS
jgi:hypothetical protein